MLKNKHWGKIVAYTIPLAVVIASDFFHTSLDGTQLLVGAKVVLGLLATAGIISNNNLD